MRELQLEWTKEQVWKVNIEIEFTKVTTKGKKAVSVAKDLRMPQFELEMVTAKNCDNKIHMGRLAVQRQII